MRPGRTSARLAALALSMAAVVPAAAGGAVPEGYAYEEAYIHASDGVRLHADILKPEDLEPGERTPVLMVVSPYSAHGFVHAGGTGVVERPPYYPWINFAFRAARAREHRYTVMVVDVRGFGASGGCWDNMGAREQEDVKTIVEWAADQEWSTGRVALGGLSYDGSTAVMALAANPRGLVGAVTFAPVVSVYRDLYMNGVPHWGRDVFPLIYSGVTNNMPGSVFDDAEYWRQWASQARLQCQGAHATAVHETDPEAPYWRDRERAETAGASDVPVLASQGFLDWDVPGDQVPSFYTRLKNPAGLWLGQFTHRALDDRGLGRTGVEQVDRFLAGVLRDERAGVEDPAVIVQEAPGLAWRAERAWPPRDAGRFDLRLLPGSYRDVAGNASGDTAPEARFPMPLPANLLRNGDGTWTFTQPLAHDVHMSGAPVLRVRADGPTAAQLVALVYDVAPDGSAFMITRGARHLRTGDVRLELFPQDWRVAAGHRLGVLLSASDLSMWRPHAGTGAEVRVGGGTLELPALRFLRDEFLEGGPGRGWNEVKRPIQISQATISARTLESDLPPAQVRRSPGAARLAIRVRPSRARSGRAVRFRFRVAKMGRPVPRAVVRFAGRRARTNSQGRVSIVRRLARPGVYRAVATKDGRRAVTRVRATG